MKITPANLEYDRPAKEGETVRLYGVPFIKTDGVLVANVDDETGKRMIENGRANTVGRAKRAS